MARRRETSPYPMPIAVELDVATRCLHDLTTRFADLVRALTDGQAPTTGLEWTLAETSVHVLQTLRQYTSTIHGEKEPEGSVDDVLALITERNEEEIAAEPERDPAQIARLLDIALRECIAAADEAGSDRVAVLSEDYALSTTAAVCGLVSEVAIHGYDIARTTGARWTVIPEAAALGVYASASALHFALDPEAAAGVDLNLEIRLRGARNFSIVVRDGKVWSEPGASAPDVRISVDPFVFLLVGYGRMALWPPLLRGQVLAWGRKPWLALKFPQLFRNP